MNLKDGDILICESDRLIPRIIKWVTKSKYNHSAIYLTVWDKEGVIEAQENGISWKPFDEWEKKYQYKYIVYRRKNTSPVEIRYVAKRALSKAGYTGYDFVSFIFRHPYKLITGKWKFRGKKEEEKVMICSEFVGWAYSMPSWWRMTPDDQKKYMEVNIKYSKV